MWILVALLSLAAFIALLLSVPVDVTLRLDVYGKPEFRIRCRWLFGLVTREVRRGRRKAEEGKPVSRSEQARNLFEILRTDGLLKQFRRLAKDVLSRIKLKELKGEFRVGLGNPVETGIFYALLMPARFLAGFFITGDIKVTPVFHETVFEGYVYGEARLIPIRLVFPLLRFAFSSAVLRVVKKRALRKWKRRKYVPATR